MTSGRASQTAESKLGPVSAALVEDLREEARKHGLLVWLDKDHAYTEFVDALRLSASDFPYPLLAYRGSFVELMLSLEGKEDGVTVQPLVLHMPGFNEEEMAQTPVYEFYCAGRRHRIALPTLIRKAAQGRVSPARIEAALEAGLTTLADADRWLDATLRGEAAATRVQLPVISPEQLFDDLVQDGPLSKRLGDPALREEVLRYLERTLGVDERWRADLGGARLEGTQALELLLSSWALCVEFVHDLRRPPREAFLAPLAKLPDGVVEASCKLASHLRERHPEIYERDAAQVEADLIVEKREATAADLGRIDTLRFEDAMVFSAALEALRLEAWTEAVALAADRTPERSFWVRRDRSRRTGWRLVRLAAELGAACQEHEQLLRGASDLTQCAERYAGGGFEVDAAHRRLEQAHCQLALVQLDEFPALRERLDGIRWIYRRWADAQAVAFNAVCKKQGFLPPAELQQRTLFDDVVRPAIGGDAPGTVAYFLVDALRFEMCQELVAWLEKERGLQIELTARYAELPTITEIGMSALAPVARDGRLQLDIDGKQINGFRVGEMCVDTCKARQKAIHERVGGETCPWISLEELLDDRDITGIRRSIARARLVVVHARGFDKAGESGIGLRHFEEELQRLRAAWDRLRVAGVRSFVLTADHGFLIHDNTTRQPVAHGRKTDPNRRHVIETVAADHDGEVRVSSTELRYDGDEVQFLFPESSMPFDTGERAKDFVHGGNSLQERVIPVLVVRYRQPQGGPGRKFPVAAEAGVGVLGLHRISGTVSHDPSSLSFGDTPEVELLVVALDGRDVAVEMVDASGARIEAGALVATVGSPFELFFRLTGREPLRTRIELRSAVASVEVVPLVLERRFAVEVTAGGEAPRAVDLAATAAEDWLRELPDPGVRAVFEHIQRFGGINEADATRLLGGPRKFRRFSQQFETHAGKAPFAVRIDSSSGQKRYMREGS